MSDTDPSHEPDARFRSACGHRSCRPAREAGGARAPPSAPWTAWVCRRWRRPTSSSATHLLGAQFELNRKLAMFFATVSTSTLDRRVEREVLPRNSVPACAGRDQLGRAEPGRRPRDGSPGHRRTLRACRSRRTARAEQRELDAFFGSVLHGSAEPSRNPLRPEVIGNAMIRGVDA